MIIQRATQNMTSTVFVHRNIIINHNLSMVSLIVKYQFVNSKTVKILRTVPKNVLDYLSLLQQHGQDWHKNITFQILPTNFRNVKLLIQIEYFGNVGIINFAKSSPHNFLVMLLNLSKTLILCYELLIGKHSVFI